ncbi:MAG: MFS transporter [Acidimicrobiia bacterium]|nr:MFS transporter [Acidimicrobiia bacterium]
MTPVERAARRTFPSLRTRNFRLYFFGQVVSGTGTWLQLVAQSWLVLQLTHSAFAVGVTLAIQFTPMLLAGAWAGVLVDRLDKRRVLIFTAAAAGGLALALGTISALGIAQVWMVYLLALGLGAVTALDNPARRAFVPEMVQATDVANAVGLNSTVFTASRVIGPAIAGLVIATLGVEWCFFINAVSFGAVIWALAAMRTSELRPSTVVPRAPHQLRDGLRYAWGNGPVRRALVVTGIVSLLAFNYQVVMPSLARVEFGGDAATFGTMMAMLGLGSLVGALWMAHFGRASTRILIGATIALGLAMTAAALAPTLAIELAVLPLVGVSSMVLLSMATAICNEETAPELRGRVMALMGIAFLGSTPIGGPFIGWVSQTVGPRAGLAIGAATALVTGITAAVLRNRRTAAVIAVATGDGEPATEPLAA